LKVVSSLLTWIFPSATTHHDREIFRNMAGEDEEEIGKEEKTKMGKEELETKEEIKTEDEKEDPE